MTREITGPAIDALEQRLELARSEPADQAFLTAREQVLRMPTGPGGERGFG
ncbi:MAG: hypothetical protein H0U42_04855, partial [Thermoleophilaceae bacterium]|nr:hypothetical protein [Thermoleophilaceae bacterium]